MSNMEPSISQNQFLAHTIATIIIFFFFFFFFFNEERLFVCVSMCALCVCVCVCLNHSRQGAFL